MHLSLSAAHGGSADVVPSATTKWWWCCRRLSGGDDEGQGIVVDRCGCVWWFTG
ncbi:hypothetical protein Hanom_Chr07g00604761 [Helianthus anomalus]